MGRGGGRDFGTSERAVGIHADIRDTAEAADEAMVELRQLGREFKSEQDLEQYIEDGQAAHRFDGGELRAGGRDAAVFYTEDGTHVRSAEGGAVLVGRDDGRHVGGRGADLSLDADTAHMGPGDDVVLLDNETGRLADGGSGKDTLIGGGASETLIGGTGKDHIRAGAGADVLYGGTKDDAGRSVDDNTPDRLAPGAGVDTVLAGNGDIVEAAVDGGSRADTLHLGELHLRGPVNAKGQPTGLDTEGRGTGAAGESYALDRATCELSITHEHRSVTVEGYTQGDFQLEPAAQKEAALSFPAPPSHEVLSTPAFDWATPDHLGGLTGPDGSVPGVHMPGPARDGLGGVLDRARAAFAPDPPGMDIRELSAALSEASAEVRALDRAEHGDVRTSPEGWRMGHPETQARVEELQRGWADGSLRDMRIEVDTTRGDGSPMDARERADALLDAADRGAAALGAQTGHTPRALPGLQADYARDHPVPGSEEALLARGDAGAVEREAGREEAREASIEASRDALLARSLADIDRAANIEAEAGAGL